MSSTLTALVAGALNKFRGPTPKLDACDPTTRGLQSIPPLLIHDIVEDFLAEPHPRQSQRYAAIREVLLYHRQTLNLEPQYGSFWANLSFMEGEEFLDRILHVAKDPAASNETRIAFADLIQYSKFYYSK